MALEKENAPLEGEAQKTEQNEEETNAPERFESDTQKIVRRHLENEDDVISEEDIRNVRVGMVPPELDSATEVRFEDQAAREKVEKDLLGDVDESKEDNQDKRKITPWDALGE